MNKTRASVEKESLIMANMGSIVPELNLLDKELKMLHFRNTRPVR